jgi:hypothetical protein
MDRRAFLVGSAATLCGCERAGEVAKAEAVRPRPEATPDEPLAQVAIDDPVDARFEGCAGACGAKSDVPAGLVIAQPNAKVGDYTHCPVSGAVFVVEGSSARREHRGGYLYFCCTPCATYFAEHSDEVLARRGML